MDKTGFQPFDLFAFSFPGASGFTKASSDRLGQAGLPVEAMRRLALSAPSALKCTFPLQFELRQMQELPMREASCPTKGLRRLSRKYWASIEFFRSAWFDAHVRKEAGEPCIIPADMEAPVLIDFAVNTLL